MPGAFSKKSKTDWTGPRVISDGAVMRQTSRISDADFRRSHIYNEAIRLLGAFLRHAAGSHLGAARRMSVRSTKNLAGWRRSPTLRAGFRAAAVGVAGTCPDRLTHRCRHRGRNGSPSSVAPGTATREKSSLPASRNFSSSSSCSRFQTPAFCQSRKRRSGRARIKSQLGRKVTPAYPGLEHERCHSVQPGSNPGDGLDISLRFRFERRGDGLSRG